MSTEHTYRAQLDVQIGTGMPDARAEMAAYVAQCFSQTELQLMQLRHHGLDASRLVKYSHSLLQLKEPNMALQSARALLGNGAVMLASQFKAPSIASSVKRMANEAARLEWSTVSFIAEHALKTMNCSTRAVSRGCRSAIEASSGNTKLLVLIENRGPLKGLSIKTDWAGLSDTSCVQKQAQFEQQLAKNGVTLAREGVGQHHIDPRGGQLIAAAGKMHADNLATGILFHEESKDYGLHEPLHEDFFEDFYKEREYGNNLKERLS